jgi:hypothetical protein
MNETTLILTVHVTVCDDHLSGFIAADGRRTRPFAGRIGLMGAIDALAADAVARCEGVGAAPSDDHKEPS